MVKYVISVIMCVMFLFSTAGCIGLDVRDRTEVESALIDDGLKIAAKHFAAKMCERSSQEHIAEFKTIVDSTMLALNGDLRIVLDEQVIEKFNTYLCEEAGVDDLLASDLADLLKMWGAGVNITVDTDNENIEAVVSKTKILLEGFQKGLKLNVCSSPE